MSASESTSVFQRISRFLVLAVLAIAAAAGGCDSDAYPLLSQMLISENGYYMAEITTDPQQPVAKGPHTATFKLMDADEEPITGATIDVEPWMPGMNHGSTATPVVSEEGGGMYTISNIVFTMGGVWELRIDISADATDDRIVSTHDVLNARHTDESKFKVAASHDPVQPVTGTNALRLYVFKGTGTPVTGATIDVEPWMPGHGHGSTEVPVASEDGNGWYTVNNIFYTMPGYWELYIDIDDSVDADSVTFEYNVQ